MEIARLLLMYFWDQIPVIFIWAVTVILALVYWKQDPERSRTALILATLFMIISIIIAFITAGKPFMAALRGEPLPQVSLLFRILLFVNLVSSLLYTLFAGLILIGLFFHKPRS